MFLASVICFCAADVCSRIYAVPMSRASVSTWTEALVVATLEVLLAFCQVSPVSCHVTALATASFSHLMSISAVELSGT